MQISKNEILFIYNSNDLNDRQALGYAKSLPNHKVKEFDLQKNKFTELQVEQVAHMLEVDPVSLIDNRSDVYKKTYSEVDLTRNDALKAMACKPELIKTPIAVYNDQAKPINSPFQMMEWEMAHTSALMDFAPAAGFEIVHNKKERVFYANLGQEQMTLEYTRSLPDIIDFTSTFVPKTHRNQGYGRQLVVAGIEYAKQEGLQVKATCPFVTATIEQLNT